MWRAAERANMLSPESGGPRPPMMRPGIPRMSNSLLLVAILLLLVVEPFFFGHPARQVAFDVLVSAVLIAAVWAVSPRPRLLVIGLALAVPAFVGRWSLYFSDSRWLAALSSLFALAFFAFAAAVLLWQALGGTSVTADTIAGAICAYLLLGVIWALVFSVIEQAHPGSFLVNGSPLGHAPGTRHTILRQELLYLSLVTLSTVGYGDVVAVTAPARMLAALEAVTGQLYLAVLIARLVGLHVPRSDRGA